MTKKAYITLCVAGIIYIIMAATAILSPHGHDFSSAAGQSGANSEINELNKQFAGISAELVFVNSRNLEVVIELKSFPVFIAEKITAPMDGSDVEFTATDITRVIKFTALNMGSSVTVTDTNGVTHSFDPADFKSEGRAYIAYADENVMPLDVSKTGYFCLIVLDGENKGVYKDISHISLG